MAKTAFPHILSEPSLKNDNNLRFVTDQPVTNGWLLEASHHQVNNNSGNTWEQVYRVYRIIHIKEERPAKGDWTGWDTVPTYYNTIAKYYGMKYASECTQSKLFNPVTD